jgi:class 3 adenylate cyclase
MMAKISDRMRRFREAFFWRKVAGTRVIPITTKILIIFVLFMISSNITTNYINLAYNRAEMSKLLKELLVKDLRELYGFLNNQYEIFAFNNNREEAISLIEEKCHRDFTKKSSMSFGIQTNGTVFFQAFAGGRKSELANNSALSNVFQAFEAGEMDGFLRLESEGSEYYTVYRYHPRWEIFLFRGEESKEFFAQTDKIFVDIAIVSLLVTLACALVGVVLLRYILRFLRRMTDDIMHMIKSQELGIVELKGASNDDVTFLGAAFNSLSSSVSSMMNIFKKFVNQDVVVQAYKEKEVRLEGSSRDLTCLFTDIRRFTFITETLGEDIISLLNLHYGNAIHEIIRHDGIVSSIIGDALLAVYGAFGHSGVNKSMQALYSAWAIQREAALLRKRMHAIKEKIEKKGQLTPLEKKVYQATLIEVGVGIDGGNVFYGNIGSNEHMTNTVIGDKVNSASRLEGLTRVYREPVVCSEYVKNEIEQSSFARDVFFVELDTVRLSGKTTASRVYAPFEAASITRTMKASFNKYQEALELYYDGQWRKAHALFKACSFEAAEGLAARTKGKCPDKWSGVWDMKAK